MISPDRRPYVIARTESGLLIIHSSPLTLSWVPRDVVNDAYNLGGIVTAGTFESLEEAKNAAMERYSIPAEGWQVSDSLPFDSGDQKETEIHSPEIDGHNVVRHGTRWK